jgi:hypothetical protein
MIKTQVLSYCIYVGYIIASQLFMESSNQVKGARSTLPASTLSSSSLCSGLKEKNVVFFYFLCATKKSLLFLSQKSTLRLI